MGFVTKVDLSYNRQMKERPRTTSILSGTTVLGVPFSALTSGPGYTTEIITSSASTLISTFTGTSASTVYSWATSDMSLGDGTLSGWTTSNSGITQNTDSVYTAQTTTTIDGNLVVLTYTGVSFDVSVVEMVELAPNSYSGNVTTAELYYLSAGTLGYTGRTIWSDNPEISRTDRLIVSRNPTIGYVLTCSDTEGMVTWAPVSGGTSGITNDTFVSGGTALSCGEITFTNTTGGTFSVTGITTCSVATGATIDIITTATTSAYTINNLSDTIFMDCTTNNVTATLPSSLANPGLVLTVVRQDNTANVGTVDVGVADLVQMTTSVGVVGYTSMTFISNGIDRWWIK